MWNIYTRDNTRDLSILIRAACFQMMEMCKCQVTILYIIRIQLGKKSTILTHREDFNITRFSDGSKNCIYQNGIIRVSHDCKQGFTV